MSACAPAISSAPRREGSGISSRLVFSSLAALVQCLDDNTLKLVAVETPTKKKEGDTEAPPPYLNLYGVFSDDPKTCQIFFALAGSEIEARTDLNKNSVDYYYPLATDTHAANYAFENQEIYSRLLDEYVSPLLSAYRAKWYPDFAESLHKPNRLKLKMAPVSAKITGTPTTVQGVLDMPGRLLIKLTNPWFMDIRGEVGKMMGVQTMLARFKYLTGAEKEALKVAREANVEVQTLKRKSSSDPQEGAKKGRVD